MNLIYKNEKTLYKIILIVSLLIWLLAAAGTVGTIFIYLFFGFLIYLFAQSGLIAYLKGSGVRISDKQFPELYAQYKECCEKLEMETEPELYILNSDGILNAFATRFLRRNYVVLYSSIVDALKRYPDGLNFYMGHELGHIKRGHLNWTSLIWPGTLLPLLGAAYSRAREYSCDLHGLYCCKQPKDAVFGMAVLATGTEQWVKLSVNNYMDQSKDAGGFWMSFHELTSDYPWLCKRMQHIMSASKNEKPDFPNRSIFASILALFVPRLGVGGGAGGLVSMMIVIAVIGILAAIAIPAYQEYTVRAKVAGVELIGNQIIQNATPYIMQKGELPYDLKTINLPMELSNDVVKSVAITDDGFVLYTTGQAKLEGQTVIYQPYLDEDKNLQWRCNVGTLENSYLPPSCQN